MSDFKPEFSGAWENVSGGLPDFHLLPDEVAPVEPPEKIDPQSERDRFRQPEEIDAERAQSTERPTPFVTPHESVGGDEDWDPETDPFDPRKNLQPAQEPTEQTADQPPPERAEEPVGARADAGQETRSEGAEEQKTEEDVPVKLDFKMFKTVAQFVRDVKYVMKELEEEAATEHERRQEIEQKKQEEAAKFAEEARLKEAAEAAKAAKIAEQEAAEAAAKTEALEKQEAATAKAETERLAAAARAAEEAEAAEALQAARSAVNEALEHPTPPETPPAPVADLPPQTPEPMSAATQESPERAESTKPQTPEPLLRFSPTAQTDTREYTGATPGAPAGVPMPDNHEPMTHMPATPPPVPHMPMPQPVAASGGGTEMPRTEAAAAPEVYVRGQNGAWVRPDGGADNSSLNNNPFVGKTRGEAIGMLLNDRQGHAAQTGGAHPSLQKPFLINRPVPGARQSTGPAGRSGAPAGPGRQMPNAAPPAAERSATEMPVRNLSPLADSTPIGRHGGGAHKLLRKDYGTGPRTTLTRTRDGLAATVKAPLNVAALPTYARSRITSVQQREGKRFSYSVTYTRNGITRVRNVRALTPGVARVVAGVQNAVGGII